MLCCRWRQSISAITEPTAAWPWTFTARTNTPLNCVRLALPALFSKRNSRPLPVCDFILMPDLKRRRAKKLYSLPKRKRHKKNQFFFSFLLVVPLPRNVFLVNVINVNVRPFFIFIATTITFNFIGPVDNGGLPIEAFAVQYKLAGQVWDEKPLQRVWPVGGHNQYYDLHDSISHASTGLFLRHFFPISFLFHWFYILFPLSSLLPFLVVCSSSLKKKKESFYSSHFQFSPPVCVQSRIDFLLTPPCDVYLGSSRRLVFMLQLVFHALLISRGLCVYIYIHTHTTLVIDPAAAAASEKTRQRATLKALLFCML